MAAPGTDLAEAAKNAGVVLTAASGAAYACGYLVIRARAHALGTDPDFALIDQNYVFAGIRFVLTVLFCLLLVAPLLLAVREIGRQIIRLDPGPTLAVEWVAALLVGCTTVAAYNCTLGVENVLLEPAPRARGYFAGQLRDAALGRNNAGVLVLLATIALAAFVLLWIRSHHARAGGFDALATTMLVIGALLLVLLPIQHGTFLADRNVRRLDRMPDGVGGLTLPVWLVDRGAGDRAVLLARDPSGQVRLVSIRADKLDGIAVTGVGSLGDALGQRAQ